ncbi:MAG: HEAT repeat domain-containing protein [Phycisphaerae bacterium]
MYDERRPPPGDSEKALTIEKPQVVPEPEADHDRRLENDASAEPMTPRLMARLFVVPLLIVVMIVGCSLAVWLLFGFISGEREEGLDRLLARIEAGSGEKVLDVALMPKDREVWQAAMELARRLEGREGQRLSVDQRVALGARILAILEKKSHDRAGETGAEMLRFLLSAAARLGEPATVPVAVAYATDDQQPLALRRDALAALMVMKDLPAARRAWPQVAGLLEAADPVLRLYATLAVGALAEEGDEPALKALRRAFHSDDREVQWNAALALARLKDSAAVPLLTDMLSRAYWEAVVVKPEPGEKPTAARGLTAVQVDEYLVVTMDAARALGLPVLRERVAELSQDRSARVKDHAGKTLRGWPAATTRPGAGASVPVRPLPRGSGGRAA